MLEAALKMFRSQRKNNIDERFVQSCEKRFKGTFDFVNTVQHHERRRTTPTTFGKLGVVSQNLTGYRYSDATEDKENNLVIISGFIYIYLTKPAVPCDMKGRVLL